MCGIFGLIQTSSFKAFELNSMSRLMRHRGPDDEGFVVMGRDGGVKVFGGIDTSPASYDSSVNYCPQETLPAEGLITSGGIALGHRRLSIIDLSAHGHQPMSYVNRYWIAYNGEVYNYLELRSELRACGYTFDTETDTEVILAAYDRWGTACLSRFNGMWGIAIVDINKRKLVLARDRFGVKPLYFSNRCGRFAFASEIKAFSALDDWRPRVNKERLLDMLVWNIADHTEQTMFDGVIQLPAGNFLEIDLNPVLDFSSISEFNLNSKPQRWYSLSDNTQAVNTKFAATELGEILDDAVRLRLRADVTVGSCLSGGLDSSTLVCLMGRQLKNQSAQSQLHTFTASSHDKEFDETNYARVVANHTGAVAHEVAPVPGRLFDELDRLSWHQDEPFVSTSIFAQWCVFGLAQKSGVTVMLDGQGADEILCGYRGFFGAYLAGLARQGRLWDWGREILAMRREIGFSCPRSLGYTAAYLFPHLVGLIGRLDNRAYADRGWLDPGVHDVFGADPLRSAGARASSVREMSLAQVTATNLPMLLHWEDRNSMAFSIEARVPFLDYRVVECCLRMADEEKLGGGISKAVLRRAMRGIVPNVILDRKDKLGFVTAEKLWATRDMAIRFRNELCDSVDSLPGILSPSIVDQFDQVVALRRPFDHRYWRAISAGRWINSFRMTFN